MASGKISVDTMRLVDYWAGVPLCAVSTLVKAVVGRPSPGTPRKVLLVELSEMGSAILVDPMMRALERRGLELHFAIFAQNKASLDLLKTVPEDNIFKLRADSLATVAVDTLRFLRWTRAKGIDTVIDLEMFSRYSALLSGWSGAGNVVGFHRFHNEGLYRGSMLTHRVPFNPHIHVLRNFFSMLHALDAGPGDYLPAAARTPPQDMELARADIPAAAIAAVADKVAQAAGWDGTGPLVLLNANASDLLPQRRWPRERFAALARKVL
ncbi:MAG: glycosyltransferase family 9 protein [Actinomycetota bacterium]